MRERNVDPSLAHREHPMPFFRRQEEDDTHEEDEEEANEAAVEIQKIFDVKSNAAVAIMSDGNCVPASAYAVRGGFALAIWSDGSEMPLEVPAKYVVDGRLNLPDVPTAGEGKACGRKRKQERSHQEASG